jgi:hypothetical protein
MILKMFDFGVVDFMSWKLMCLDVENAICYKVLQVLET